MILHITHAKTLPGHRLHVRFSTGQEGDVDLSQELTGPAFDALQDDGLFSRVAIHSRLRPLNSNLLPPFQQQARCPQKPLVSSQFLHIADFLGTGGPV